MKKLYFVSALLIIASMVLAACGGGAPATEAVAAYGAGQYPTDQATGTDSPRGLAGAVV